MKTGFFKHFFGHLPVVHLDHPGVVGLYQDVPLGPDVGQLLLGHHVRLSQDLHGVDMTCVNLLYQPHLEKKDQTLVVLIIINFAKSDIFVVF